MTRILRAKLASPSWLRPPRRTARLRLTLIYGALFLVSGAALLTITYFLFERGTLSSRSENTRIPAGGGPSLPRTGQLHMTHVAANAAQQVALAAQAAADKRDLLIDSGIALAIVAALALLVGPRPGCRTRPPHHHRQRRRTRNLRHRDQRRPRRRPGLE
jgi:hypothetical protein